MSGFAGSEPFVLMTAVLSPPSDALGVPIAFFFEGFAGEEQPQRETAGDIFSDKEALALVRSYYAIPEAQRRRLFELAKVLSTAA